jgi:hypothetical protein
LRRVTSNLGTGYNLSDFPVDQDFETAHKPATKIR